MRLENQKNVPSPSGAAFWTFGRVAVAIIAVIACIVVAGESWSDLFNMAWHDEEASHVLLVPVGLFWLVWVRKNKLAGCHVRGLWLGTCVLALGWLMWSVGYRHQIESFWHGGAVLMAVGGLLSVLGVDVFLKLLPAFALLVFLVPVPATGRQLIALPMQHVTAELTQRFAEVLGMSVTRQGNLLNVNGTDVAVVEACNGMRMIFTLMFACYVFAFVNPLPTWARAFVLLASPLVAVACNVIRLVPTIWVFGHYSQESAERFHDAAGWSMLFLAFGGLLGSLRLIRWMLSEPVSALRTGPMAVVAGASAHA